LLGVFPVSSWAQNERLQDERSPTSEVVPEPSEPSVDLSQRLPMGMLNIEGQSAAIPDWQIISFETFPPFPSSGQWGDVAWSQGDRLADVLTLGDFQESLDLHLLTLAAIAEGMGMPAKLNRNHPVYLINLGEFRLLERQTIASLVAAVPSLLEVPIRRLPPIQDLVESVHPTFLIEGATLEDLLSVHPEFAQINLSELILEDYRVGDLPGIELAPMQSFAQWQEAAISEVPMLPAMSWWLFPQQPQTDGAIATVEVNPSTNSVELIPPFGFDSTEWTVGAESESKSVTATANIVSPQGRSQINDGKELEGAFPFGRAFKVVPTAVTPRGVETAMYFRTCRQVAGSLDCSAYGIGPIPLQTYRPGETVFLGEFTFPVASTPQSQETEPSDVAVAEPEADFFSDLADTTAQNQEAIGTVAMILTLLAGALWWAWKGDPIQFFVLTFRWLAAVDPRRVMRQLSKKPESSTVEPSDAEKQ
jgi:hypothetical protein